MKKFTFSLQQIMNFKKARKTSILAQYTRQVRVVNDLKSQIESILKQMKQAYLLKLDSSSELEMISSMKSGLSEKVKSLEMVVTTEINNLSLIKNSLKIAEIELKKIEKIYDKEKKEFIKKSKKQNQINIDEKIVYKKTVGMK